MLRLNSNNQIVSLYFYDNKKQSTIVSSSCHLKANVNHLRSTSTYTSYFLLLFFVTKYYKSAVYVGGDSVKSDQTYIPNFFFILNYLSVILSCIHIFKVRKWHAVIKIILFCAVFTECILTNIFQENYFGFCP
jgi:hypothetical protein